MPPHHTNYLQYAIQCHTVDLENQEITGPDGGSIKFELDAFKRHCLLNGLDDISLTLEKSDNIASYENKLAAERPWA